MRVPAPRIRAPGAGAGVKTPDIDVDYWLDLGPTNDRAMFDNVIGTVSHGDSPLTLVLQPGGVGGVGFVEVSGREIEVTLTDRPGPGATQVYHRKIDLDGTPIFSVYDWFFAEYEPLRDVVLTDLPEHWRSGELTIKVTATSGQASIGVCKPAGCSTWAARAGARGSPSSTSGKKPATNGATTATAPASEPRRARSRSSCQRPGFLRCTAPSRSCAASLFCSRRRRAARLRAPHWLRHLQGLLHRRAVCQNCSLLA